MGVRGGITVEYADSLFESVARELARGGNPCSAAAFLSLSGPDPSLGERTAFEEGCD